MTRRVLVAAALMACGARTDLGGASRADAAPPPPQPPPPCFAVDYLTSPNSRVVNEPFVVDESSVYYLRVWNVLSRMPKGGGAVEDVVTFDDDDAINGRFIVDATTIYWANSLGEVFAQDKNGGSVVDLGSALAPLTKSSNGLIAANDTTLVVLVDPATFGLFPKAGGVLTLLDLNTPPTGPVVDAHADASRIYWTTGERVYGADLTVGADPSSYGDWPTALAVDETSVYWSTTSSTVEHVPKSGGSAQSLGVEANGPIAVGQSAVFAAGNKSILKISLADGTAQKIVPAFTPVQLVTDETCLYYASSNGQLARVPQ